MHQKIIYLFFSIFIIAINNDSLLATSLNRGYVELRKSNTIFEVEIADTKEKRKKGLMFRKELSENNGMLFVFPYEQKASVWMKNTLISLDVIFISKDKLITEFINNATPLSQEVYTSKKKIKYILEINSGLIEALRINLGDQVKIDY